MSSATASEPALDRGLLAVAGVVVLAAIVGYYVLANSPFALRAGLVVAGLVVALVIAWTSQPGKDFIVYCQDSTTETKKVVWPSRKETLQTTGVVVAFVIVMAIFLWAVDASLVVLVRVLVGREA